MRKFNFRVFAYEKSRMRLLISIGIKLHDYQSCNLIPICQFPLISAYGAYLAYTEIHGGRISGFGRFLRFNGFLIAVHRLNNSDNGRHNHSGRWAALERCTALDQWGRGISDCGCALPPSIQRCAVGLVEH